MGFQVQNGCLRIGDYKGDIEEIIVPSTVKIIDREVFYHLNNTKTIVIPESVMYLGEETFSECPNLESVNIPASVTYIHINFFYNCPKLKITLDEKTRFKKVECHRTITHYYYDPAAHSHDFDVCNQIVFHHSYLSGFNKGWRTIAYYKKALVEFFLHPEEYPEDLRKINQKYVVKNKTEILKFLRNYDEYDKVIAFYENIDKESGVIDVNPDNDISAADNNAEGFSPRIQAEPVPPEKAADFQIKDGILEKYTGSDEIVTIPAGVIEIGKDAFSGNERIKKIIIPSDVKKINSNYFNHGSFRNCSELSEVIISEGVTDIGMGTFSNCTELKTVSLPVNLLSISKDVFIDCINLENIKIPPRIQIIEDDAFNNCRSLKNIVIPESVVSIGEDAFNGCEKLSFIHIPASVTEISAGSFWNCPNLEISIDENTRFNSFDFPYYCGEFPDFLKDKIVKSLLYRAKITGMKSKKIYAAIQFILEPDPYPADIKEEYLKFCKSNRQKIINEAGEENQEKINAFFDELDRVSGFTSGKKKLNDNEKVLLLEKMADEGTFEEFREVFEKYKPFEFYPRVLEKACISGDIKKVKLLVDAGAGFTSPYKNVLKDRYIIRFNYELEDYHYPKKGMNLIWHPDFVKIISSPKSTSENIVNILLYLKKKNLINQEPAFLASVLARNEEVAKRLYANRFRIIPANFQDCFSDYMRFFKSYFPVKDKEAIKDIADDFSCYGLNFYSVSLPESFLEDADSAFYDPELLNVYLIKNGGSLPFAVDSIFDKCIRQNRTETIEFLIESGQIVPYAEKYIDAVRYSKYQAGGEKLESIVDHGTPEMLDLVLRKTHWPMTNALFSSMYDYAAEYKITAIKKWLDKNKAELLTWKEPDENATLNESNCKLIDLDSNVYNFTTDIYEITSYSGKDADVIIPARISDKAINSFKKAAFRNKKFKSVIIEEGITFINEESFAQCKNLESVTLPESVLRIGRDAFKGCEKLKKIDIPSGVRCIDSGAFSECSMLSEINIMPGTKFVGANAFSECRNLQTINIPESVIYIGSEAFLNCDQLVNVTLHEGLQHVCTRAFSGCEKVVNVQLPDSLKMIDEHSFPASVAPEEMSGSYQKNKPDTKVLEKVEKIKKKLSEEKYTQSCSYDRVQGELFLEFEAKGTMYNDVYENVKHVKVGDTIRIIRDPENKYNHNNFRLENSLGESVGNMPAKLCNALAPFYDNDEIILDDATASHVSSDGFDLIIDLFCVPKLSVAGTSNNSSAFSVSETRENISNENKTFEQKQKDISIFSTFSDPLEKVGTDNDVIAVDKSEWKTIKNTDGTYSITKYLGTSNPIVIPSKIGRRIITTIKGSSFDFEKFEPKSKILLIISNGISKIEEGAFGEGKNLVSFLIPKTVTFIGTNAFTDFDGKNKENLIIYGKKGSYAEKYAEQQNINFVSIADIKNPIPEFSISNTTLVAYNGNNNDPVIPEDVTIIGSNVFSYSKINSITLPDGITTIENFAFKNCKNLSGISFPKSLIHIGKEAFSNCEKIEEVSFPDSVTFIGEGAFSRCTGIKTISMPPKLSTIQPNTFYDCFELSEIRLSENVINIGDEAFAACSSLRKINIPKSIVDIGKSAFAACDSLRDITLPDTVKNVNYDAFRNCRNLKINGDDFVILRNTLFAYVGKKRDVIVPENVISINEKAFYKLYEITSITLPEGLKKIGSKAFSECTGLRTINIPDSVDTIETEAFKSCSHLKSISIPNGVLKIEECVFDDCSRLLSISIPDSVLSIEKEAFKFCSKLKEIAIPSSVVQIGDGAFEFCDSLRNITLPESVEKIGEDVFSVINSDKIKLYVYKNSAAEEYAIKNKLKYEIISREKIISSDYPSEKIRDTSSTTESSGYRNVISAPFIGSIEHNAPTTKEDFSQTEAAIQPKEKEFSSLSLSSDLESMHEDKNQIADTERKDEKTADITKHQPKEYVTQELQPVEKIEIKDPDLAAAIHRAFVKLEKLYPEHKVFALDSLDSGLRNKITDLYKRIGYVSDSEMLQAYGFEFISGEQVKSIRPAVVYTPGNEPEIIKPRIASMLQRLNEYYPDHVIPEKIENAHKKLSQSISGLYQWLGYQDAASLLKAYGFDYLFKTSSGGRPAENNYEQIIQSLVEKYKTSPKPKNMADLIRDNPEIKGKLKSLQNEQYKILGTKAVEYLKKVGVIKSDRNAPQVSENLMPDLKSESDIIQHDNAPAVDFFQVDNASANDMENKEISIQEDSDNVLLAENLNNDLQASGAEKINAEPDVFNDEHEPVVNHDFVEELPVQNETVSDMVPVNGENDNKEDYLDVSAVNEQGTPSLVEISSPEINRDNIRVYDMAEQSDQSPEKQLPVESEAAEVSEKKIDNDYTDNSKIANSEMEEVTMQTTEQAASVIDQKTAWIQYQAYEVVSGGRASAYFFFDLRNEMALGNYNWQSEEFLYFYMKYFPGMPGDQLQQLRTQAVPWLNTPNVCNAQYQIIMQDTFEHRYVMIASAWLERAANYDPVSRVQFVFNTCRSFFYPQEQQTVWQRLCGEAGL